MHHELVIELDHSQFYIEDDHPRLSGKPMDGSFYLDRVWVEPGHILVVTERFDGDTRVVVEALECRPDEPLDAWDHVVECGIALPSGHLNLRSLAYDDLLAARLEVPPGSYRALIFYGGLDTVTDDGEGDDHYRVVLWPGRVGEPKVLKRDEQWYQARLAEARQFEPSALRPPPPTGPGKVRHWPRMIVRASTTPERGGHRSSDRRP
jgi:hypothetical protein